MQARIRREAATARRYSEAAGLPLHARQVPTLVGLYEHALGVVTYASRRVRVVNYCGAAYPLEFTNFGRLRVLDPATRELLISGPIGGAW